MCGACLRGKFASGLLLSASLTGLVDAAESLLPEVELSEFGGLDFCFGSCDSSALATACARADVPMVRLLLSRDASTNEVACGSKVYNTFAPLYCASRMGIPGYEGGGKGAAASGGGTPGKKQAVLNFAAGAGGAQFHLPSAPTQMPVEQEEKCREAIVRMLVAKGAGTVLEVEKRPVEPYGWGSGEKEPVFIEAQAALISRALAARGGA